MGASKKSRNKKRARSKTSNEDFSDHFRNFNTLFPVIQSPQGMKPPVLKNLYRLLDHLSSNAQWSVKYAVGSHDFDLEICHDGIKVTIGDICELSNILFKELEERFEQFVATACGESSSHIGLFDAVEVMNLLFRCCMLILTLLAAKQNLLLEKGPILLGILKKLSSPNLVENSGKHVFVFERSAFYEGALGDNGCTTSAAEDFTASLQFLEPYNPHLFLTCSMLEVFLDELFVHGQLRGYFKMINSVASINERLFSPHSAQGDTGIVIEAICNHFILSFSDEQAFGDFMSRLFFIYDKELRYPFRASALGITAAVSLLLSPIMISAPKYIQAHLISLVSEAADVKSLKPDRKLINGFLSTFEKSITLYMTHMSCLKVVGFAKSSSSNDSSHPPFEFYVSPETKNKVDSLITKLDDSSNLNLNENFLKMKSDMVTSSMRFAKECQNVYAMSSCQDEILAILSCLVLKASESFDDQTIRPIEGTILQQIYLLASLLKLMSISLLQAVWCLRRSDDSCCLKTLKDFSSCKEYDFILGTIKCFGDLEINLPLQQVLSNVIMSSGCTRHMDSKMMFLHFIGLMSLSFVSGLDCLVKGCLLTILALLNLFVFEDGGLDALQLILDSNIESSSSGSPVVSFQETVVNQNSSLVVASKFQKIRSLYSSVTDRNVNEIESLSSQTIANASHMKDVVGLEEETEETSNGEIFFKCMLKMGENTKNNSNFDDLVSFVECKPGKDYSAWLRNRQRYRKWKGEKMAVFRWKRKKKIWKTFKGKRN
ncbi:hypothetical protein BUALT_Bualt08G0139800 [Buddleja alternifolia]|uniref:DUF7812 domain-containing protein n=1 Tax=Buddleja alternifolia TaxID=168488 RepID=A0AAV6X7R1_9LAMI|nr:hypothetical protein BUALT_Bualt08G0139800 [Buddleja alternifolia]